MCVCVYIYIYIYIYIYSNWFTFPGVGRPRCGNPLFKGAPIRYSGNFIIIIIIIINPIR